MQMHHPAVYPWRSAGAFEQAQGATRGELALVRTEIHRLDAEVRHLVEQRRIDRWKAETRRWMMLMIGGSAVIGVLQGWAIRTL